MHANRFPDLEAAAERLRTRLRLGASPTAAHLRAALEAAGTASTRHALAADPELAGLRSVLVPDRDGGPTLHVNGRLLDEQLAFVYARELGFLELGATDRPLTSSWIQVDRFEQVLDNFRGSYVAGALLLPAAVVDAALVRLADAPRWDALGPRAACSRARARRPRCSSTASRSACPRRSGWTSCSSCASTSPPAPDAVTLTKSFNLSRVPVPHGVADDEHYCRRWADSVALRELDRREARAAGRGETGGGLVVAAQRQHFLAENAEFFVVSVARPLSLQPGTHSAVSLGVLRTRATRRRIRFWDDPALPLVDVGLTCERCAAHGLPRARGPGPPRRRRGRGDGSGRAAAAASAERAGASARNERGAASRRRPPRGVDICGRTRRATYMVSTSCQSWQVGASTPSCMASACRGWSRPAISPALHGGALGHRLHRVGLALTDLRARLGGSVSAAVSVLQAERGRASARASSAILFMAVCGGEPRLGEQPPGEDRRASGRVSCPERKHQRSAIPEQDAPS